MDTIQMTMAAKAVLGAFIGRPGEELSGADIARATGVKSGSLYPILRRFEKKGVLASRWENIVPQKEGRPQKRLYKFTSAGLAWAIRKAKG